MVFAGGLVGREREVSALAGMLGDRAMRLVTVTGPAGVGKTRVANAVADRLKGERSLRIIWVELAPLSDPRLVADAIAAASEGGGRGYAQTALEAATAALGQGPALLVLDNFEHLGAAAGDVAALLDCVPGRRGACDEPPCARPQGRAHVPACAAGAPGTR